MTGLSLSLSPELPSSLTLWLEPWPQAAWVLDQEGRVLFLNKAARQALATDQALLGQSFTALLHPEDRAGALAQWLLAQHGQEGACWSRFRLSGSAEVWRQAQLFALPPELLGGGLERCWGLTCLELPDPSEASAELTARCHTLQTIVDANADCIKLLDLEGRLLSINIGGQRVMEIDDARACLNALWPTFWEGETRAVVDEALNQVRQGQSRSFEGFCPTMKGTPRWWEVSVSPLCDAQGQVVNILATSRDITARKEAQQQLLELNANLEERVQQRTQELSTVIEQLRASNADLERFAYVAAHDLQEPIRTVASFSDLLERKYQAVLDSEGQRYLGIIRSGAGRMKTLVDDLLAFARISHDRHPRLPLDLAIPWQEALARLQARLAECPAEITHDPLPTVLGNSAQLAQVLQNLLSNALKFTPPGRQPRIHLAVRAQDQGYLLELSDQGIGMEPRHLERIFQMFQRLHPHEQYEGTGMGLAICQKIIEAHGGRIWATSAPAQGSCFHFTLPRG